MLKRYSIADARDNLASIVHDVERNGPVELTRRGEPVAVLIPASEYQRLVANKTNFWDAFEKFRQQTDEGHLLDEEPFESVRDRSHGRDFSW